MNTALDVIAEVQRVGVTLRVCDGKLLARPMSALPSEIAERARQHRDEIIELLARLSDCEDRQTANPPETDSPSDKQREIDPEIAAEIERIEGQALALGWSRERLRNSNFWYPWPRGLAAVLDAGDRIVEVTGDYIRIERPQATGLPLVLRFWRTDG